MQGRAKKNKNIEKLQDEKILVGNQVKEAKDLIVQEYKDNLKNELERRLDLLADKIEEKGRNITRLQIDSYMRNRNITAVSPKYSPDELAILFNYYQEMIEKINERAYYIPTKKQFCSFCGISSIQYNNWLRSEDPDRADIMQKIDDYITDTMLTSAQNKEIDNVTTIFRTKAEHNLVEAQAPIVIEHKSETNIDDILSQVNALKSGKSLIELEKGKNGVYTERND